MAQKTRRARAAPALSHKPERKGETTQPNNLLKLIEAVGMARTSRELGVSTTTLHKARKANLVTKAYEVAAGAILRNVVGELSELAQMPSMEAPQPAARPTGQQRQAAENAMFLIEVPADKAAVVRKVVEMAHGKLLEP